MLRFYLGTDKEHTVYEAEEVGLLLAAKLIATKHDPVFPISILINNQAVIQSSDNFYPCPGSYLADLFRKHMGKVVKEYANFNVMVRWVLGHEDVHGNEEADKQAKRAAEGTLNNSQSMKLLHFLSHGSLPLSILALIQSQHDNSHQRWLHLWRKLPRYQWTNQIDPNLLKRSFVKLAATYPKCLMSLLMNFCTQHIPLNKHLFRLLKSETPSSPHCPDSEETVHHYLFDCPKYHCECHTMSTALGWKATSLPYILTKEDAIQHLVKYVNSIK